MPEQPRVNFYNQLNNYYGYNSIYYCIHAKLKLARLGTFVISPTWRGLVYYMARFGLQEKICYGEFRCNMGKIWCLHGEDMLIFQFSMFLSKNNTG